MIENIPFYIEKIIPSIETINKIGVIIGPGKFTSLRIGVNIANAIGLMLNTGVIPINSLDLWHAHAQMEDICILIDAYRNEFYCGMFSKGLKKYMLCNINQVLSISQKYRIVAHQSLNKKIEQIKNKHLLNSLPPAFLLYTLAKNKKPVEYAQPFYLKKTDAERNLNG